MSDRTVSYDGTERPGLWARLRARLSGGRRQVRPLRAFRDRMDITISRIAGPDRAIPAPIDHDTWVRFTAAHPRLGPDDRTFTMRHPVTGKTIRREVGDHVALMRFDHQEVTFKLGDDGAILVDALDHPVVWSVLSELCTAFEAAAFDDATGQRLDRAA